MAIARVVPDRREPLDEIARRDHLDAGRAHELDRARVDARDVRDRAVRRVLHRDAPQPLQQLPEPGFELVAARVPLGRAGKMRERVPLDGMDQPARLAGRGNQVVPAARRQMSALPVDRRSDRRRSDSARESRTGASRRARRREAPPGRPATSSGWSRASAPTTACDAVSSGHSRSSIACRPTRILTSS